MTFVLTGTADELQSYRALKVLATAAAAKSVKEIMRVTVSSEEVLALNALAKGLVLTLPDGKTTIGGSSSSIMRAVASFAPALQLTGQGGDIQCAKVDSWIQYGVTSIEVSVNALQAVKAARRPHHNDIDTQTISQDLASALSILNSHLLLHTYMVGNSVTIADIGLSCALYEAAACDLWNPGSPQESTQNVCRWYNTLVHREFFQSALATLKHSSTTYVTPLETETAAALISSVAMSGHAPPVQNRLYKRNRIRIKEVLADNGINYLGQTITVAGWTQSVRNANKGQLLFIGLNDGSTGTTLQCLCEQGATIGFDESKNSGGTGSSFQITGTIVQSLGSGQAVELKATTSTLLGAVYGADAEGTKVGGMLYPMSKKAHTLEHMREHAHLRPRARLHAAAMRIRHSMAYATHKFFHDHGFLYIHTPIITCADCEGAGEQFAATTLLGTDHLKPNVTLPVYKPLLPPDEKEGEGKPTMSKNEQKRLAKKAAAAAASSAVGESNKHEQAKVTGAVDYSTDFFGKRANLTVSGQLNVETHACALSDVYTFGPTFRAENSHTARHLSEFWMIEPEIAFADLNDDIDLAEDYLKYCVQYALEMCAEDLEFFEESQFGEPGLRNRLKNVLESPFVRLTYTDAIEVLKKAYNDGVQFEVKPEWGIDLPSEHERYLCEKVYNKPVVLMNYPKDIKAFYMKLNDDGKTVAAADILVPKIGEIIGGSQREHRKEVLVQRCIESHLDPKAVWWYIELRKYGTVPHAGFGLGFERLILFITGLDNIRDVIPFPRWAGNAEF